MAKAGIICFENHSCESLVCRKLDIVSVVYLLDTYPLSLLPAARLWMGVEFLKISVHSGKCGPVLSFSNSCLHCVMIFFSVH